MRHVALLVVFGLLLVACGGSGDSADPDRFCEVPADLDSMERNGPSSERS